jgi:hypothetical protein
LISLAELFLLPAHKVISLAELFLLPVDKVISLAELFLLPAHKGRTKKIRAFNRRSADPRAGTAQKKPVGKYAHIITFLELSLGTVSGVHFVNGDR